MSKVDSFVRPSPQQACHLGSIQKTLLRCSYFQCLVTQVIKRVYCSKKLCAKRGSNKRGRKAGQWEFWKDVASGNVKLSGKILQRPQKIVERKNIKKLSLSQGFIPKIKFQRRSIPQCFLSPYLCCSVVIITTQNEKL